MIDTVSAIPPEWVAVVFLGVVWSVAIATITAPPLARFPRMILASVIGSAIGQILGAVLGDAHLLVGNLHVFEAIIGATIGLVVVKRSAA